MTRHSVRKWNVNASAFPRLTQPDARWGIRHQIAAAIIKGLDLGLVRQGQLLPDPAQFQRYYGVSYYTIDLVLTDLVQKGYVRRVSGYGAFYTGKRSSDKGSS